MNKPRTFFKPWSLSALIAVFLAVSACGSSGDSSPSFNPPANEPITQVIEPTATAAMIQEPANQTQDKPTAASIEQTEETEVVEEDQEDLQVQDEPTEETQSGLEELVDKPFLMPIEDIFSIRGRGTVIAGRIERGTLEPNTEIEIIGGDGEVQKYLVTSIEMFQKLVERAVPGDNVGLLLRGANRDDLSVGQVAAFPGSISAHQEFSADVHVLTRDEGGQHRAFFPGYRPQFYFWTLDVTGEITLPEGVEMVMPGDNANLNVRLITPVALEEGSRFAIREGGMTVGAGVVTKIIN